MPEKEAQVSVREMERAEVPWVVAYLREDIQDLRNEVREVRRGVQRLDEKLEARTDELRQEMSALRREMDERFDGLRREMSELRREMSVQFRWMVGTMVAIGALIVAALKLLP